jgi:hypothetical protein
VFTEKELDLILTAIGRYPYDTTKTSKAIRELAYRVREVRTQVRKERAEQHRRNNARTS